MTPRAYRSLLARERPRPKGADVPLLTESALLSTRTARPRRPLHSTAEGAHEPLYVAIQYS